MFANIGNPLTHLTKEGCCFIVDDDIQEAFNTLKTHLTSAPVYSYLHSDRCFILDASNVAIGGILSCKMDTKVLYTTSKVPSKAKQNYCATRRKFLA